MKQRECQKHLTLGTIGFYLTAKVNFGQNGIIWTHQSITFKEYASSNPPQGLYIEVTIHLNLAAQERYPVSTEATPNGFVVTYSNGRSVEYGVSTEYGLNHAYALECPGVLEFSKRSGAPGGTWDYWYVYTEEGVTTPEFVLFNVPKT